MAILDPQDLEGVSKPELVFALVSPVGTPMDALESVLEQELKAIGYATNSVRLSRFLDGFDLGTAYPSDGSAYEYFSAQMDRGDELRELMQCGEALALLAAAKIWNMRPKDNKRVLEGTAHILRQLKHQDEAVWLRKIYGRALHVIGVFCPEKVRQEYMVVGLGMTEKEARELIERDTVEKNERGQQVAKTFHRSDLFLEMKGIDAEGKEDAALQFQRYIRLLLGEGINTPTRDEYGMFLAQAVALRSADLSRQVGAAILSHRGDVLSVGCNAVPSPGGGQYWGGEPDGRDAERGFDANERMRWHCLGEVVQRMDPTAWDALDSDGKNERVEAAATKLNGARLMNLTEFGRSVHAEMEAIVAAGRTGTPVCGADLYTTTFPCHNCAKHIVCSGIARVVYIEPYPKSMAAELHDDSISLNGTREDKRVRFEPFRGVAPRMYPVLFSILSPEGTRLKRKEHRGDVTTEPLGIRLRATALHYVDREALAGSAIESFVESLENDTVKWQETA
jgi:deoxycytidylate deaminase